MKNKKGFTLVELLAVIVILAILAAAAFTLVVPRVNKAKTESFINEARSLVDSSMSYFLENLDSTQVSIDELINRGYTTVKGNKNNYAGTVYKNSEEYSINFTNGKYRTDGIVRINNLSEKTIEANSGGLIPADSFSYRINIKDFSLSSNNKKLILEKTMYFPNYDYYINGNKSASTGTNDISVRVIQKDTDSKVVYQVAVNYIGKSGATSNANCGSRQTTYLTLYKYNSNTKKFTNFSNYCTPSYTNLKPPVGIASLTISLAEADLYTEKNDTSLYYTYDKNKTINKDEIDYIIVSNSKTGVEY